MKNTWRCYIDGEGNKTGRYYEFKNFKIYTAYREYGFAVVRKWDLEQSFTGKFVFNGFEQVFPKEKINVTCNWFGVSVYQPDLILIKGDKKIIMSLQGLTMRLDSGIIKKYSELLSQCACKYILMEENGSVLHETWTGELPSKELINKFIS